jgi:hypothetical protein
MGEWSPAATWPIVAVHSVLLHTGEVLIWDAWETPAIPRVWNPNTNTFTIASTGSNIFCGGQIQLPDGRILVVGGHNGGEYGIKDTLIFDPATRSFSRKADMAYARWYPADTPLADGRALAFSGNITPTSYANTPEVYDPKTNTWTKLASVSTGDIKEGEYPTTFQLPDGRVLAMGPESNATRVLDIGAGTYGPVGAGTLPTRYGSFAYYQPGKVLYTGGGADYGDPSSKQAAVLDMTGASPAWRPVAPMASGRYMHNLVVLPDGKVLAVGGAATVSQETPAPGPLAAEMFDPATETWSTMAAERDPRMYHSTTLLMPDGRVMAAGGGRWSTARDYFTAEFYSPPYLFKGARPVIAGAPTGAAYGSTFAVQSPDAASIASVSLVDLGSNTHANDMSQRYVPLSFTVSGTTLTVQSPASGNIAPPGYYMLFLVNGNGVPSVAAMLQVGPQPDTQAPVVTITAPAGGANVSGAVTVSATASDDTGVASVQFLLDGAALGSPDTTAPYSISWDSTTAANGSHTLTARATDLAGNPATSPPVSVTVNNAAAPPTISAVTAKNVTATGATITWTTSKPATSRVEYGTSTSYGSSTTLDSNLVTSHSQTLSGLVAGTLYNFHVRSADAGGNEAVSDNFTFTTLPPMLLGNQSVQSNVDYNNAGVAEAFLYTAPAAGAVSSISVYIDATSTATSAIVGLYANLAGDVPGALLTQGTISSPVKGAWNTVTVPATGVAAGAKYWLALLGPSGGGTMKFRDVASGGAKAVTSSQTNLATLPSSWSNGATWQNTPASLYASGSSTPDTQAPSVTLTAPAAGANVSGTVTITATATDNVAVANVQFLLDGNPLGPPDTASPYSTSWDTTAAANGPHTLGARATDTSGNPGTATTVSVTVSNTVDTTPPVITGVTATNISGGGATIIWTTDESADSQVDYGTTAAYGSSSPLNPSRVTSHSVTLSGLTPNTTYHYQVKSSDAAGNDAAAPDATFTTSAQPVLLVGSSTVQSTPDSNTAGRAEAFQYTAAATGSVTTLYVYVDSGSTATKMVVGLYTDSANNPGSLLAQGTITSPVKGAWNSVRLTTPVAVTANANYWMALLGPSGSGTFKFRDIASGGGRAQTSSQSNLTTLPATWSRGTNYGNSPASAYATQE